VNGPRDDCCAAWAPDPELPDLDVDLGPDGHVGAGRGLLVDVGSPATTSVAGLRSSPLAATVDRSPLLAWKASSFPFGDQFGSDPPSAGGTVWRTSAPEADMMSTPPFGSLVNAISRPLGEKAGSPKSSLPASAAMTPVATSTRAMFGCPHATPTQSPAAMSRSPSIAITSPVGDHEMRLEALRMPPVTGRPSSSVLWATRRVAPVTTSSTQTL
jgi:hypothetical protein